MGKLLDIAKRIAKKAYKTTRDNARIVKCSDEEMDRIEAHLRDKLYREWKYSQEE